MVGGISIKHVALTDTVITDYDRYANLVAYKAVYHIQRKEMDYARAELSKLESLYDGKGFADRYFETYGRYETYKVALALIVSKALNYAEGYSSKLLSIKPFTSLYLDSTGEGDLNVETATMSLIGLYSSLPYNLGGTTPSVHGGALTLGGGLGTFIGHAVMTVVYVASYIMVLKAFERYIRRVR